MQCYTRIANTVQAIGFAGDDDVVCHDHFQPCEKWEDHRHNARLVNSGIDADVFGGQNTFTTGHVSGGYCFAMTDNVVENTRLPQVNMGDRLCWKY